MYLWNILEQFFCARVALYCTYIAQSVYVCVCLNYFTRQSSYQIACVTARPALRTKRMPRLLLSLGSRHTMAHQTLSAGYKVMKRWKDSCQVMASEWPMTAPITQLHSNYKNSAGTRSTTKHTTQFLQAKGVATRLLSTHTTILGKKVSVKLHFT